MIDLWSPSIVHRLVQEDRGDEEVHNPFIELLADRSHGLPIYVELVRQDIAQGRFRYLDSDEAEHLPDSVSAYFKDLLSRGGLGDVYSFQQLIVCFLALALEPLSIEQLAALIRRIFDMRERQAELTKSAIDRLGSQIRARKTPDGEVGWTLYHTELMDFVRRWEEISGNRDKALEVLLAAARSPTDDAIRRFLFRRGVQQHVAAGRTLQAAELLSNVGYQIERLKVLAPEGGDGGIRADWDLLVRARVELTREQADWQNFWATDGARFCPDRAPKHRAI
jgi:hypothetical protein